MRLAILLFFLAGAAHAATTITLTPLADAYTIEANPAANFGNSGALVVAGADTPKDGFQSVLRFDLATVKSTFDATYGVGNWTLDSVQLRLTSATPNNASFNANNAGLILIEWLADDSWLENSVTWNFMPSVIAAGSESLASHAYNGASSGNQLISLMPSSGFSTDLSAGGVASFRLAAGDALVSMTVNSRNFGTAANRPALIFTASPEPARALFLAVGGCVLLVKRRRCRL